jgi:hypothetical protein
LDAALPAFPAHAVVVCASVRADMWLGGWGGWLDFTTRRSGMDCDDAVATQAPVP